MTEIEIATGIETGTVIEIEIAATTITGSIATGTEIAMTAEFIETEMIADITAGTGETTGGMIAAMTATTGAGMEDAGFTGMAVTGFTKRLF
jgi:hypothetical protein